MQGYTELFVNSENNFGLLNINDLDKIFGSFRTNKQCFSFIENGDIPPDNEAVVVATSLNKHLYNYFYLQLLGRKNIGYNESTTNYANYNNLDSRHIMFSVIMWNFLQKPIKNILEIGGGYANLLYLNRNQEFDKWDIIDLPYMCKLQEWMLNKLSVNPSKYRLYSAYNYEDATSNRYDLVIGTHSLSELSINTFNQYFVSIIKNSKYLFYSYHKYSHFELVELKRNIIEQHFDLIYEVHTENNNVSTCLFKNKL